MLVSTICIKQSETKTLGDMALCKNIRQQLLVEVQNKNRSPTIENQ